MTLAEYLTATQQGIREFARRAKISPATVCRVASGKPASLETAEALVKSAGGHLDIISLMRGKPKRRRNGA